MLLLLPALLVANVAAYGIYQPSKCKPLPENDQITYTYSEELDGGFGSDQKYNQGTKVKARCAKTLWDLMGNGEATCKSGRWTPEIGSCIPGRCSINALKSKGPYERVVADKLHGMDKVENLQKVTAYKSTKEAENFICCLGHWMTSESCPTIMKPDLH
ncbi:unnamed protein product [Nippostrongylus brasiliensis]|uniref:Sushi domain-containing protein n=1 Tax=Nippostrongylus brasiliensis TaxID=27835 RepID=A0A0N4XYE4_NIPBR|nr:unnamed protein product [Nippostrongylus brasiliensis]